MQDQETMQDQERKPSEEGVLGRLAGRGEDALTRLMDDLGRNSRVTDALARTMSAKERVDETTRKTLSQIGLAAAAEIRDLRAQVERLEKRVDALEARATAASRSGRKPATSTKSSGGTAPRASTGRPSTPPASPPGSVPDGGSPGAGPAGSTGPAA